MPEEIGTEFKILNYDELDAELKTYEIKLIEPSAFATQKINKKFVAVQACKDRVQSILEDAIKNTNIIERRKNSIEFDVEREKEKLLINNDDVKALSSQDKRNAAVNIKLEDKLRTLLTANALLQDSKDFEERVRLRLNNLESANKNLSRLISTFGIMFMRGEMNVSPNAKGLKLNSGGEE